jgi:hypothetical protein
VEIGGEEERKGGGKVCRIGKKKARGV